MRSTKLWRYDSCAYFELEASQIGLIVKQKLWEAKLAPDSSLHVLRESFSLPCGVNFYRSLRLTGLDYLLERPEWLELWSPMERSSQFVQERHPQGRIIVPNFLLTVNGDAIAAFLRSSEQELASRVCDHTEGYIPRRSSWLRLLRCLEASILGSCFPPSLIAYCNFIRDFAEPAFIDDVERLKKTAVARTASRSSECAKSIKPWRVRRYPRFRSLVGKFARFLDLEDPDAKARRIFSAAFAALPPLDTGDDAQLLRAAFFFAEMYCILGRGENAKQYEKYFPDADYSKGNLKLSLSSRLTYLRCFPKALYCIRHRQKILKGPLGEAQKILVASGLFKMRASTIKTKLSTQEQLGVATGINIK